MMQKIKDFLLGTLVIAIFVFVASGMLEGVVFALLGW